MMASLLNFGDMRPGAGFLGLQQDVRGVPANRDNVFGRIGQVITDNPLTLMALGAGIARGGIGAGLQFAVPALEAEQEQRRRDQAQTKTYQGLRAAGTPFGEAMVGALHPEVLKAIARSRFVSTQLFGLPPRNDVSQANTGAIDPMRAASLPSKQGNMAPAELEQDSSSLRATTDAAVSFNAIISHLSDLREASTNNANDSTSNDVEGAIRARAAKVYRDAAADKIAKLLRFSGINDGDIDRWNEALHSASTTQDVRPTVKTAIELITSRLDTLNKRYPGSKGRSPEILSPKSQAMLASLSDWASHSDCRE